MMNYYYECNDGTIEACSLNGEKVKVALHSIKYNVFSPSGELIAEATTEENANLIVTMMNGDHSGE